MPMITFGTVLGRLLSRVNGLGHVHLPDGIGIQTAEEIVRAANQKRPSTPPFSLLVSNGPESLEDPEFPLVSPARSIQSRQGDHVAVVYGRQPDLSSFVQVFREIFGQSFPEQAEGPVALPAVSDEIVNVICEELSLKTLNNVQRNSCSSVILGCLTTLIVVHSRSGDTGRSWNSAWFAHVDQALTNLAVILRDLQLVSPRMDLVKAFNAYAYACFALPVPSAGAGKSYLASEAAAGSLGDSLGESWADRESFSISVAQLPTRPEVKNSGGEHPLAGFVLDGLDDVVSREGNAWLGLAETIGSSADNIKRFSSLTEEQFRSPARDDDSLTLDVVFKDGGGSLALDAELPESPFLIPLVPDGGAGGRQLQSEVLKIRIPTLERVPPEVAQASGLWIQTQPVNLATWEGTVDVTDDGDLLAVGRFVKPRGNGRSAAPFRLLSFTVKLPSGDPLTAFVRTDLTAKGYVFSGVQTFLAAAPYKNRGGLGRVTYLGPMEWTSSVAQEEPEREFAEELPEVPGGYQTLLWAPNANARPLLDGVELTAHRSLGSLYTMRFAPTGQNEFAANGFAFRIRPVAAGSGHQSALLAAAVKQQVVSERPKPATEASLRGQVEAFYARHLGGGDNGVLQALGHIMMPSNMPLPVEDSVPQDRGAFLMADAARRALDSVSYFEVDADFVHSAEAERFRNAFRNLKVDQLLLRQDVRGEGVDFEWPSKTSWRSLWSSPVLKEYLDAYSALVQAARTSGRDENLFWAAYPMSVSVWDVKGDSGCQAVLLSPLHPIRLAWLVGAEHTLFEAAGAVEHAGSVEGWNLPLVGPGESITGRMLAVPADSGEDQIFLGWSMMLPAAKSRPKRLSPPERIGDSVTPGAAVSGLNATAVDAALKSFRRMHPHITTLTVDLHAQDRQNRMSEIDDSVLAVAEEWGSAKKGRLIGGVRVFDSVKREGSVPRDAVTKLVRENRDMLLTWSRYTPQSESKVWCNIRLLQDSGTTVRVDGGGSAHGVIGNVPLRRFESNLNRLSDRRSSLSEPAVPGSMGWSAFSSALESCEAGDSAPVVEAAMMRRDLADTTADWTVMGESFLSPAIMAELMDAHSDGGRMLWEWRPPVFERSADIPFMERRSFVSIAKVPDSFGRQLESLLTKATGRADTALLKRQVMSSLGSRGVGLSSLLAMGGTHVAGAMGFYLTFSLFDHAASEEFNRFIVPIDAADYFLRTLSGQANHGSHQRRADLLLIELRDEELILCPVEIKCYGLKGESVGSTLPSPGSRPLEEPLDQLAASSSLLDNIEVRAAEVSGADRVVWMNSLGTLVETAARLSGTSGSPEDLARRLSSLVDGRTRVRVGKPLLTYLQHGSKTSSGEHFYAGDVGTPDAPVRALIANTAKVFESLEDSEHTPPMIVAWRNLIDWAVSEASAAHLTPEPTLPEVVETGPDENKLKEREPERENVPQGSLAEVITESEPAEHDHQLGIQGDGVRIDVGSLLGSVGKSSVDFWPSNTNLNQMNVGIVGDLGTGKTELVKSLIAQIREQSADKQQEVSTSMLIFDYKGDFQRDEFISRVNGIVLKPHDIPVNVFMPVTEEHSRLPYQQAAAFVDVLRKIYRGVGPVQSSLLNESVRDLYERHANRPPTLAEVREEYLEKAGSPDSVSSILDSFVLSQIFSSDRTKLMSFSELLEGKVVVVALDRLGPDQSAKNALVALFLNLYYDNMLRSERPPFQGSDPQLRFLKSFLLVDEAVNIMRYDFQVLMDLMLQGRQFGYGVMLASQYLSHYKEGRENFGQPLRTWFIHKVPSVNARELASLGLPDLSPDVPRRIPELRQHEVLYRSLGYDEGRFVRVQPYYERYGL